MINLLAVIFAGAMGAFVRWTLTILFSNLFPSIHYATLCVNILGCFFFGIAFALLDRYFVGTHPIKLLILTGFLGSFTTFSTFVFDSVRLLECGEYIAAASNIIVQNFVGIGALAAGLFLGRSV